MPYLDADVAVVGAGFAGLACAKALRSEGRSVVVLEARDRVGGRVYDETLSGEAIFERGAQWLGSEQYRMQALAKEYGVEQFPTYQDGSNVFETDDGRLSHYHGTIPNVQRRTLLDFRQSQLRLDRMAHRVPLEAPWHAERATQWDSDTVDSWARRNCVTAAGREMWNLYCEAVFSVQSRELSLLHLLFYARSGGGSQALVATEGGVNETRAVGGLQQIATAMAAELGAALCLSAPVTEIHQDAVGITVLTAVDAVRADRCVIALPPTLAGRLTYSPALPGQRDQLTQRVPMGSVIKCIAVYDEPFWRHDGFSGQATSTAGPVKVAFDNSPPSGVPGILLGFLEGDAGRLLGCYSAEERRRQVLECFVRFFGPRAVAPELYLEQSWVDEEFTRGCYSGHFPPGVWTSFGPALRAPIGRLHWAGTETAAVFNGYVEGAVRSGERTAAEVIDAQRAERMSQ